MCSMVDPCILKTSTFELIEVNFKGPIQGDPTYMCDICCKFGFRSNVSKLNDSKYQLDIVMVVMKIYR